MTDLYLMLESGFNGFLEVPGYRLLCVTLCTSFFLKPTTPNMHAPFVGQRVEAGAHTRGFSWSFAPVKVGGVLQGPANVLQSGSG